MIKIPDYQNDTTKEISQEIFSKDFNLPLISFSGRAASSDDYDYLATKLPWNFTKQSISLILELYDKDFTILEMQDILRKKHYPTARYVILAILKKNSPKFREFG